MRLILPTERQLTLEMPLAIRWGDMDALGHVNNVVYFRYLETVRVEWLRRAGLTVNGQGQGAIVVNAFCNFLRQVEYPGELLARHYIANLGRSSFDALVTLARAEEPDAICAEVRRRDAERLQKEMAGGVFAGKALILGNIRHAGKASD